MGLNREMKNNVFSILRLFHHQNHENIAKW